MRFSGADLIALPHVDELAFRDRRRQVSLKIGHFQCLSAISAEFAQRNKNAGWR
jgi:hypothetical protein